MVSAPVLDRVAVTPAIRRRRRLEAQAVLWRLSSLPRVKACQHHGVLEGGDVVLRATGSGATRHAGFAGLGTCGSTWSCPQCAHRIARRRVDEIAEAMHAHHDRGGRVVMVTLTMRHHADQSLKRLWDALSDGWEAVTSGRAWKSLQEVYGFEMPRTVLSGRQRGAVIISNRIGYARVVEVTLGENGWHVHIHALLFVSGECYGREFTDRDASLLAGAMFKRWAGKLSRVGVGTPSGRHGFDGQLVPVGSSNVLADYFEKSAAWELAGGSTKSGRWRNRTPFGVLGDIVSSAPGPDRDRDVELWREWEQGSHGRRQLVWTVGLRAYLGLGVEATDEDIAAEEIDGEPIARLSAAGYRSVRLARADLLDAAESDDDGSAARAWLRTRGVRQSEGAPNGSTGSGQSAYDDGGDSTRPAAHRRLLAASRPAGGGPGDGSQPVRAPRGRDGVRRFRWNTPWAR